MSGVELESFSLCGGVYCGVVSCSDFSGVSVLVLVSVFDCGMFFCSLNGVGKGGVGSIVLRSAVAVSTVKRSMAVYWSTGYYSMTLLGIC